ncbi:hypothetical protein H0X06_03050 [Candidatus Dependentiae bacterium]|nr:hypothetical protein [Candidatus Dependentiae bacterium]
MKNVLYFISITMVSLLSLSAQGFSCSASSTPKKSSYTYRGQNSRAEKLSQQGPACAHGKKKHSCGRCR